MNIYLGADHAAYLAKNQLVAKLTAQLPAGDQLQDLGPYSSERCDYSDYAILVARQVQADPCGGRGILLCGSGIGMSMAANRFRNIRAALCRTADDARLAVQHNNANILCFGARVSSVDEMFAFVEIWLGSTFENDRHCQRLAKFNLLGT